MHYIGIPIAGGRRRHFHGGLAHLNLVEFVRPLGARLRRNEEILAKVDQNFWRFEDGFFWELYHARRVAAGGSRDRKI